VFDLGQMRVQFCFIFEIGHVLENVVANWLRNAGFELETVDALPAKP
jgi:hypothetical protein